MKTPKRREQLIEGSIGPFYVAPNAPTFYLIAALYAAASVVLVMILRGRAAEPRLVLAIYIPFETGLLAHIYGEKVRGWTRRRSLLLHLAASLLSIRCAVLTLL